MADERKRFYKGSGIAKHREWRGLKDTFYDYLQWAVNLGILAQFAAKSIALESAGFGEHMSLGNVGTVEENVMYDNASAVPFAVPQPASMQMTLEQAKALPCRIKKYGQMTLGQLALTDPQSMQWIINESNFDDAFKQAAHMIVRSYQSMSA